jgi:ABC-type nitrate/sulfonate/bicarbonate transport system ATPase subunit
MEVWLELDQVVVGHNGTPTAGPVTLSLPVNEPVLAVVGRSGVGKTTLLHTLGGHLSPISGRLRLFGTKPDARRGDTPILFQDHRLFPWMTAQQNVEFALRCAGTPPEAREGRALQLLSIVDVAGAAGLPTEALSGGMAQRVALARALAAGPKCLLLDEPFSALDPVTKAGVGAKLKDILAQDRLHAVMVSHHLDDALDFAQNILVMRKDQPDILVSCAGLSPNSRDEAKDQLTALLSSQLSESSDEPERI